MEERFQVLDEQVIINRFKVEGRVVECGDFNVRCCGLCDMDGESGRSYVDMENGQGELLVDCMRNSGLIVNGRQGLDQFTCISSKLKGSSVVDYCLVPEDELMDIHNLLSSRCYNVKNCVVMRKVIDAWSLCSPMGYGGSLYIQCFSFAYQGP